jgi:Holliday junction resolvase RusA-like endonuclease
MQVKTIIYVEPTPKARPRFGITKTGKRYAYKEKRSAHAEALIRENVLKLGQRFDAGTPLKMEITFYRQRPKSLPKRVKYPVQKPDLTNYLRLVEDSLEGYLYSSDSNIVEIKATKGFGEPPRIELLLESLD